MKNVEVGAVYVGPKDGLGDTVYHWKHGYGKVISLETDAVLVLFIDDVTPRRYAVAFAPQKPKLVKTNSEQGKTCVANVKLVGTKVFNKDDGKLVGYVSTVFNGHWFFQHTPNAHTSAGDFTSKHQAVKALVNHVNAYAEKQATLATHEAAPNKTGFAAVYADLHPHDPWSSASFPVPEAPAIPDLIQPPAPAAAPVSAGEQWKTVKQDLAGHQLQGVNPVKDHDGKIVSSSIVFGAVKLGYTESNGDGTMKVFHADGTIVAAKAVPQSGEATNSVANYHCINYGKDAELLKKVNASLKAQLSEGNTFLPTELSLTPGGLHNEPELGYTSPPQDHRDLHYKVQPCAEVAEKTYSDLPGAHLLKLTGGEKGAIKYYTGNGYVDLNNALRAGQVTSGIVASYLEKLDRVFYKTPELEETIVIYRGIDPNAAVKLLGDVGSHVGKTFTEPGYSSCSAYPSGMFVGGVVMRVTVPHGSHVLKPSKAGTYDDKEFEVTLPRGARFLVMRDQAVGDKRQIDLVFTGSALN